MIQGVMIKESICLEQALLRFRTFNIFLCPPSSPLSKIESHYVVLEGLELPM